MSVSGIFGPDLVGTLIILGVMAGLVVLVNFLTKRQKSGEGGSYHVYTGDSSDGGGGDGGGD